MVQQIATSILIAVIMSAGAAFVSVKVMSTDLDRAKEDIAEVSGLARRQAVDIAQMQALQVATERGDEERWQEIRRRLTSIEADQKEILRSLPERDRIRNR